MELQPQQPLGPMIYKILGDSGTRRYSGYFSEEPNYDWRDELRVINVELMRRTDATVKQLLNAIKAPLLGSQQSVETKDESTKGKEICEFVKTSLFGMDRTWKDFLRESLTYFDFGFSVFEQVYRKNGKYIGLEDLAPRIQHSIQQWQLPDGRRGIQQINYTDEKPITEQYGTFNIPMNKLLVFTNDKEGDDLTGQSILRAAWKHFYIKDVLYKLSSISHDRYGVGIPVIKMPEGASDEDKTLAKEFGKNLRSSESSYIVLPSPDWTVEILTPTGTASQSMQDDIQHHDRQILAAGLASFLSLGSNSAGSFALSKDQSDFFMKHVEDKGVYIAEQINTQVIKRLVDLNFGPQEHYPELRFLNISGTDLTAYSGIIKTLADAGLVNVDADLISFVHKKFNLPEISDKKLEEMKDIEIQDRVKKDQQDIKPVDSSFSDRALIECLYEYKPLELWRGLTKQEERCQLQYMNDQFDELQKNIQDELEAQIKADLDKNLPKIERRLTDGDLAAIALLLLFSRRALGDIINRYTKAALEVGKTTASDELKVERPVTPTKTTQVMNFESSELADDFANSIESQVKQIAKEGIAHDIQTTAVVAAIATAAIAKADNLTKGIAGQVIGQNINRGRTTVFDKNKTMIKAFQRSEILDNRTCPFCVELDKKIVSADDPMSRIEQIHTYCRGLWMPIQQTETIDGPVGLPRSIEDRFDKVGGVPVINQFKQIKKEKAIAPNSV